MDVGGWLRSLGLGQYEEKFQDNKIDAGLLPRLTVDDLKDIGVSVVGDRRRLLDAIAALADAKPADVPASPPKPAPPKGPEVSAERRPITQLDQSHPYLRQEEPPPGPASTIGASVDQLDLATVIRVSRALSSEIVVEILIGTLMRTAVEQAGAERGLLISCANGRAQGRGRSHDPGRHSCRSSLRR